jgi:hypothetical protein
MLTDFLWNRIINHVVTLPIHQDHKVSRALGLKLPSYAEHRLGFIDDEILDNYCIALIDGSSIHIKVYENYYLIHRDWYDPNIHPVKHLIFDAPKETLAGLFLIDQFLLNGRVTNWVVNKVSQVLGVKQ